MCPSYMATREEAAFHARPCAPAVRSVDRRFAQRRRRRQRRHDALDLCLSCKGCKRNAPPASIWRRTKPSSCRTTTGAIAGRCPLICSAGSIKQRGWRNSRRTGQPDGAIAAVKARARQSVRNPSRAVAAGVRRTNLPRLVRISGEPRPRRARSVVLFPDTFTNFFEPQIARAAVEVLERAGFQVEIPPVDLCCGRPLFDQGMLDTANRLAQRDVATLGSDVQRGQDYRRPGAQLPAHLSRRTAPSVPARPRGRKAGSIIAAARRIPGARGAGPATARDCVDARWCMAIAIRRRLPD